MNKVDLLNHALQELSKTLGESMGKLDDSVSSKMDEEMPHKSKMEQIKMKGEMNRIEKNRNEVMLSACGASRAKEIIKFLDESGPYFTLKKAQDLVRTNFKLLSDEQLQKKFVMLRDFERYTNNTQAYMEILINGGYFVNASTHASTGLAPKDIWLAQNLKTALDEATAERNIRMKRTGEAWNDPSVMGGKTDTTMPGLLKVEQSNRPKDGKELDAWIKQGKAPNDTGPVYSNKEFEEEEITKDGNLVNKETGNPVPQLYVGAIQGMNGVSDKWIGKPIKFLGRMIWAFAGRGYGHEVEVDGSYGVLSLNGVTDKPTKRNL